MNQKVLRMGVLGAANIARQFIAGVNGSALVAVECVASRDAAKGRAFAAETGVARSCDSYEALLADPAIDAVYNPLPNALHAEWSIRAARGRQARAVREAARGHRGGGASDVRRRARSMASCCARPIPTWRSRRP